MVSTMLAFFFHFVLALSFDQQGKMHSGSLKLIVSWETVQVGSLQKNLLFISKHVKVYSCITFNQSRKKAKASFDTTYSFPPWSMKKMYSTAK